MLGNSALKLSTETNPVRCCYCYYDCHNSNNNYYYDYFLTIGTTTTTTTATSAVSLKSSSITH